MTDYATFLASKQRDAPEVGRQVSTADVHPMLHPWQREIVAWAVRTGRAAIWADTGIIAVQWVYASTAPSDLHLQAVRASVRYVRVEAETNRAGSVLLARVRWAGASCRIYPPMRNVRRRVLPASGRAGHRSQCQSVLLAGLLHGLACVSHGAGHLCQTRVGPCPQDRRCRAPRPGPVAGRGCSSHRLGQAQQRPVESGRISGSVVSREMPLRRDVR